MKKNLGFGILGAGLVAPFHAKAILGTHGGVLVGFCDSNPERLKKITAEFGVKGYATLREMLNDPGIDVVNVCTPNHLHHQAVLACAAAGKHLLTEKPPAMSLEETDEMIEACRRAGVKFGCFVQRRMGKAIQAIKQALNEGRFGTPLQADTYMKWFRTAEYYQMDAWRSSQKSGAGVTVQQAFHYIDLLQYLMGPVWRVHAQMRNVAHPAVELEDTMMSFVEFANGTQGVVQASTALWPGTDARTEIHGTNGTAIVSGEKMVVWQFRDEQPQDEAIRQIGVDAPPTGATGGADFGYADHQVVIQDMIDAVRENREVCIPVSTVRPTVEIVLGMYLSAVRNAPVDFPTEGSPF